jgi:hypothetical protein
MNQYMFSVHSVEGTPNPTDEEMKQIYADVEAFNQKLFREKIFVFGGGLHPASTATVVNVKDGEALLTDGPFAEAKEHLGGFWVIKAPDLDAALALAKVASIACHGPVEVRPFQETAE